MDSFVLPPWSLRFKQKTRESVPFRGIRAHWHVQLCVHSVPRPAYLSARGIPSSCCQDRTGEDGKTWVELREIRPLQPLIRRAGNRNAWNSLSALSWPVGPRGGWGQAGQEPGAEPELEPGLSMGDKPFLPPRPHLASLSNLRDPRPSLQSQPQPGRPRQVVQRVFSLSLSLGAKTPFPPWAPPAPLPTPLWVGYARVHTGLWLITAHPPTSPPSL